MKSKGITEKAQNAIFDEEQFRCATPDECLEFLQDDSNFKNISEQLIESVERKTGIARTEDETIDYLTDELMKLERSEENEKERHKLRIKVSSWINGVSIITVKDLLDFLEFKKIKLDEVCQDYLAKSVNTNLKNDDIVNFIIEKIIGDEKGNAGKSDRLKFRNDILEWKKSTYKDNWRTFRQLSDRNMVIKICFALKFNLKESNEFLRKACGLHPLSSRNVSEAICMNCLQYGKPYSCFQKILSQFNNSLDEPTTSQDFVSQNGNTTKRLAETAIIDYESDEDFFRKFLLPNKEKFIGYSKTVQKQYFMLKRKLTQNYIGRVIYDEYYDQYEIGYKQICDILASSDFNAKLLDFVNKYKAFEELLSVYQSCIANGSKSLDYSYFWNYLSKALQEHEILQKIIEKLQRINRKIYSYVNNRFGELNSSDSSSIDIEKQALINEIQNLYPLPICDTINELTNNCTDFNKTNDLVEKLQKESESTLIEDDDVDNLLGSIITFRHLITTAFIDKSLVSKKAADYNRYYTTSDSTIKKVTDNFVTIKNIGDLERNPSKYSFSTATRKIIVILFYLNYIYDWEDAYKEKSVYDFFWGLDELLETCNLAPIYLADQFDWLVFKSIRNYELAITSDDELDDAISFLQDVIAISFPYEN